MGGVINIITKQGTPKTTTEATVSYEEHNSQDYQLSHGGQKDQLRYFVAEAFEKPMVFHYLMTSHLLSYNRMMTFVSRVTMKNTTCP